MARTQETETGTNRRRRARYRRWLGTALVVVGALLLVWSFVVWRWNDPFTAIYTHRQQHELGRQLDVLFLSERKQLDADLARVEANATARERALTLRRHVAKAANQLRSEATEGQAIGRIRVPELGLNMVLVNGTTSSSLKKGPGRDPRTYMPGQSELVYIAGHRTTYAAPFAHIERLRVDDRVEVEMPYGTFRYRVTGHEIVTQDDLSVLRSNGSEQLALQACHPRFFATHRYIVWAKLVGVTAP